MGRPIHTTPHVDTLRNSPSKVFKMSSGKVKSTQLWDKSKDDLLKQLGELKSELGQLRVQQVASSGSKFSKIHDIRKSIARVLAKTKKRQSHFPQRKFAVKAA